MIFKSIKLENFRQYKGVVEVEFSTDKKKPISLVIADNGVGKTTFIQAFRYCFYGSLRNNKYLNLPVPEELLNNTVINDVDDEDSILMSVTIEFAQKNKNYIMKRTSEYKKILNKIVKIKENSSLSYSTDYEGTKTITDAEADIEMSSLLPAGLSHIFMFDGERMEKQVGSKEFQTELKESILGILGIKKYDELVETLGNRSLKTSVIGRVHHSRPNSDLKEAQENNRYNKLLDSKSTTEKELLKNEEELINVENEINSYKTHQEEISINKENLFRKKEIENEIEKLENKDETYSVKIIQNGLKAYKYQILLSKKIEYEKFIAKAAKTDNFYRSIHINTIEQILESRKCICGTNVLDGSIEQEIIEKLKEIALPDSRAQNLSYIESDIYAKTKEYNELVSEMKDVKKKQTLVAVELQQLSAQKEKLELEIKEGENIFGEDYQVKIEELDEKRIKYIQNITKLKGELETYERMIIKSENTLKPMWEANEENKKISLIVRDLEEIKENLLMEKEGKEHEARIILAKHFNRYISKVLQGDYKSNIDDKYAIKIIDNKNGKNVIDVLSTGQNVIISVSFINSLIETAKEISDSFDSSSKYGVIMDAALSNLDETHIKRVGDNNLNSLDQLIFLSFKRQIRGELYESIKDKIGKAYVLTIDGLNILKEDIDLNNLEEFIKEEVN